MTVVVRTLARTIGRFVLGALVAVGCSPAPSSRSASQPESTPSANPATAGRSLVLDEQVLPCGDVIATAEGPSPGHAVVLDRVALPTDVPLQANASGDADPAAQLFAKDGLLIRPGASFELEIPENARGYASMGWGSPGGRTSRLVVPGCGRSTGDGTLLVYAGGYWVAEPMCLPLVVKAGQATAQVSVAVGAPCPAPATVPPGEG